MVELVGFDKRVLDVGCAGGYLGEVLIDRGCRVVGIEFDPEMAAEAKRVLDDVLVADLEELDMASAFGPESFDVVVFGDVLEHLRDPTRVLRQARSVLKAGGYVVVSIPNVAHGSVRLALLHGKFEYSETGLLDDTHLRWFTRDSVESLFSGAGFVMLDLERTELGVFDTEIVLRREDFDPDVVAGVEQSPEALTYQFVARGVPDDVNASIARLARRETTQRVVIEQLRGELEAIRLLLWPDGDPAFRVGVLGDLDGNCVRSQIAMPILISELAARIGGLEVRPFALGDRSVPLAAPLDPAAAFGHLAPERAVELTETLDAMVVLDDQSAHATIGHFDSASFVVRLDAGDVAPIELLATRHFDRAEMQQLLESLRVEGRFPQTGTVIALLDDPAMREHIGDVVAAFETFETGQGLVSWVVLVSDALDSQFADEVSRATNGRVDVLSAADPMDLLAGVAGSAVVIGAACPALAVAAGLGRPAVVAGWVTPDAEHFAARCGGLSVAASASELREVVATALVGRALELGTVLLRIDERLDALAIGIVEGAQRRERPLVPLRAKAIGQYFDDLRLAYDALAQRAAEERCRLGRRMVELEGMVAAARVEGAAASDRELSRSERDLTTVLDQANRAIAAMQLDVLANRGAIPEPTSSPDAGAALDTRRSSTGAGRAMFADVRRATRLSKRVIGKARRFVDRGRRRFT